MERCVRRIVPDGPANERRETTHSERTMALYIGEFSNRTPVRPMYRLPNCQAPE
jgi:hypothetical protein